MTAWEKCVKMVESMTDEDVRNTWNSIPLSHWAEDCVNDIPADDWMELVYSEMNIRDLL
jgi:hypothetical protein